MFQNPTMLLNLMPWFERYYIGGMKLAKMKALKVVEDRKNKAFIDILQLLADKI